MRKYMWPNSSLPSATALITAAHVGSQGRFTVQSVENHAPRGSFDPLSGRPSLTSLISDYPRTLREWGRRLEANLTQGMIAKDYPSLKDDNDFATFKRKWQYLFAYAGAGFAKGYIACHMLTFIREVRLSSSNRLYLTHQNSRMIALSDATELISLSITSVSALVMTIEGRLVLCRTAIIRTLYLDARVDTILEGIPFVHLYTHSTHTVYPSFQQNAPRGNVASNLPFEDMAGRVTNDQNALPWVFLHNRDDHRHTHYSPHRLLYSFAFASHS